MAEGVPVNGQLFVTEGGKAHLRPDPPINLANPGFELKGADGVPGWQAPPQRLDSSASRDTSQACYGNSSLCVTNAAGQMTGAVYCASQKLRVPPFRLFRVSVSVKSVDQTRGYVAVRKGTRFLAEYGIGTTGSEDWRRQETLFNSLHGGEVVLSLGVYDMPDPQRMWFDDVKIEPVSLSSVLDRAGCPFVVRNERGRAYEEGVDYEIVDSGTPSWARETELAMPRKSAFLRIGKKSRIRNGERLRVSYCALRSIRPPRDAALCVSSDRVYEFFDAGVGPLSEAISPFAYLLATRYVGTANWDDACLRTKKTPGAQWGDSLQRQLKILGKNGKRPMVFVWSDMYEPWTDPYKGYWVRNGSFEDAWKYLPKDFTVLNAHYAAEESKSPRFFAANGYRQVVAGDASVGEWMQAYADIPGIVGVMNVDAPLDEFAAKAWGWLPKEVRDKLPPAPKPEGTRRKDTDRSPAREGQRNSAWPHEVRTWTDASGQHTVEAALVTVKASIATL